MKHECAPEDVAMKTFFLGPQAENKNWVRNQINLILDKWFAHRESFKAEDGPAISIYDKDLVEYRQRQNQVEFYLNELIERFNQEIPKFNPRYIAHMFSETSLPALFGHILTLLHNPNNVSGEASRVGIQIEKEAYKDLSQMLGYNPKTSLGHFTSGGTVANFEALVRAKTRLNEWLKLATYCKEKNFSGITISSLWDAAHLGWEKFDLIKTNSKFNEDDYEEWKKINCINNYDWMTKVSNCFQTKYRGPVLILPSSCHYSWPKAVNYFGDGEDRIIWIPTDENGRTCIKTLNENISQLKNQNQPIWAVISIAGTTELGIIDEIDKIQNCINEPIWHHIDAAYGGFLCSLVRPQAVQNFPALRPLLAIEKANSVTVDPHKLGYVPYSSGVIAVRTIRDYNYLKIDAPYIQFKSENDVGLQTLEGSRSAAGAVATWLTEKTIGLNAEGYGRILGRTITAARELSEVLKNSDLPVQVSPTMDSNVLVFTIALENMKLSESNLKVNQIYKELDPNATNPPFLVSKTSLKVNQHPLFINKWIENWKGEIDCENMDLIRLCIMNPFFSSKETKINYQNEFLHVLKTKI